MLPNLGCLVSESVRCSIPMKDSSVLGSHARELLRPSPDGPDRMQEKLRLEQLGSDHAEVTYNTETSLMEGGGRLEVRNSARKEAQSSACLLASCSKQPLV